MQLLLLLTACRRVLETLTVFNCSTFSRSLTEPKVYHIVNVVIVAAAVAVVFVVTYLQECAYVNFKWRTRYDEGC
jgi:hypothetical protein